jgi:hypothetical protein
MSISIKFKTLAKIVKHQFLLSAYPWAKKNSTLDLLVEAFQGIGARWIGEYDPIRTYTVMFDVLRQNHTKGFGLEIGGGYSTILLSEFVCSGQMHIESIDVNPNKYLRIIPSARSRKFLFEKIKRIDRLSVSFDEVLTAYRQTLSAEIQKIGLEEFNKNLKKFMRKDIDSESQLSLEIFSDLGNYLLSLPLLREEKKFYVENNLVEGYGYCHELQREKRNFDFIFFDCGEYSSLAEWFLLENRIKPGGHVILHDIFYPKSIKNFVVAALISSSTKWEIVYLDHISEQGGLVARRRDDDQESAEVMTNAE